MMKENLEADSLFINNIIECSKSNCDAGRTLKALLLMIIQADIEDYFDNEDDEFLNKQKDAKIFLFKLTAKCMENKII